MRRNAGSATSKAEGALARALRGMLSSLPTGAQVATVSLDVCESLERFAPELLRLEHAAWEGESLDGVMPTRVIKTGPDTIEMLGTCILISDQTVTPFLFEFEVAEGRDAIRMYHLRLGEPGDGPLGISGPPCNSGAATRLASRLEGRLELGRVAWVYMSRGDGEPETD
ncbi:MAG: hypothetical protein ABMB14_36695 [Myxococcota bacterium]